VIDIALLVEKLEEILRERFASDKVKVKKAEPA